MNTFAIGSQAAIVNAPASAPPTPQQRALVQAAKTINESGQLQQAYQTNDQLSVVVDRSGRLPVARIVNRTTGEVLEQIPNEEVLRMAEE